MYKHKISGKSSEKLLVGSMAAAALGLINAKPKTVKADSINKSRSTLSKANKRAAKTKLSYQTTAYVKTAAPTEDDQKVENDQGTDNEADSENNSQPSVTTQNDNANTTENNNVETNHPTSDSESNKFDSDEAKRDDTTSLQGTWTQNKIPVTFNTDTGVMEIGDKTKESTFNWDGNGSAGIANHIQGITNFDPTSVKEIHIIGKMIIQNNADGLFEGLTNLTKITGLEKFDTKETYDMESMFKDCASLTSLDLSSFNTQKLSQDVSKNYSMQNMFEGCTSLVELNILNFEADYVSATKDMFKGVTKLRKLVVGADFCAQGVTLANTGLEGEGSWVNMGEGEYADSKGQHIYQTTADFIKVRYLNDTYIRFENLGGKITVHYQDNEKKAIPDMDDDDQFGNIGDSLVNDDPITAFQPKDKVTINGKAYTLSGAKIKDNPVDLKDVKFTADQQDVTLIYAPEEAKSVNVYYKYKDKDGNLQDILDETGKPKTKTISGKIGDKPTVTFDDLANYKKDSYQINDDPVTESTDNPAVTLSDQEQKVTLIYDRIPAGKVTVYYKYKDEAGNLQDIPDENGESKTTTVSGYLGDKPTITFDDLANYKKDSYQINDDPVTESTDNPAVTLSDQEQKVTLIYDRIPAGKVTVYYKYKDEAGKLHDILDENGKPKTTTVSGYLGDKSSVSFDDLANYKKDSYQINDDPVTESTDNPTIPLSEQEQKVTLIYTEKKTNNGSESNGSESNGSGSNGSESNGSGSNGSGSNGSESNGSGSNGSGSNGSESNGSGSNGSESNGSGSNGSGSNGSGSNGSGSNGSGSNGSGSNGSGSNGSGSNGSGSNGSGSNGSGSNDSNASNTTGSIVNSPAAIAPAVTVHYQDEYGNTVAPDRVIQGRIGDGYTTGAETVSGYSLKTRPDNATGFFINSPQSVTYVYSKNDGQTNNSTPAPAGNQTPTDNEPTPIPSSKKNKKKKAAKKASKGLHANKQSKKAPAKSIKGLTANKNQANRPAANRKLNKTASAKNPQKGKLDKGSRTDALPQTGSEKHNGLAMLALGGLALATALGAAWLERKKE